ACEAELALNRRTAPQLYLQVKPVCRSPDGTIGWDGVGAPLDWVVVMRRFDQQQLLDHVARSGSLSASLMLGLTAHIAAFHGEAEPRPDYGGAAVMAELAETNLRILRGCHSADFDPARIDAVAQAMRDRIGLVSALLDRRRAEGKVRRC